MLKTIFSIISFLLLCGTLNAGDVDKKLHQHCLYPTVLVGRVDEKSFGSGVIVRSEKISDSEYRNVFLTCAHLVKEDGYDDYEVTQCIYENWSTLLETKKYPALFYAYNHDIDLAIGVFISQKEMPIAKLNFDPTLFIGNDVFRIGYGFGDEPRLDYGKLTWRRNGSIRTSIFTVPGDSGSPLFHENEVIGIMVRIRVFRKNPVFNISYAVGLEVFKIWSGANGKTLDFPWDKKRDLPKMHYYYLNFKNYDVKR